MSLVRLPLAAVFWWVATERVWAAALVGVAALTDALDGRLARRALARGASGWSAGIGGWLDPLCDKLFAIAAIVALGVRLDVPLAWLALVVLRDLLVVPLTAIYVLGPWRRRDGRPLRASVLGKATTVAQFVTVLALLLAVPGGFWFALATAALGAAATIAYVVEFTRPAPRP